MARNGRRAQPAQGRELHQLHHARGALEQHGLGGSRGPRRQPLDRHVRWWFEPPEGRPFRRLHVRRRPARHVRQGDPGRCRGNALDRDEQRGRGQVLRGPVHHDLDEGWPLEQRRAIALRRPTGNRLDRHARRRTEPPEGRPHHGVHDPQRPVRRCDLADPRG